ncbi:hypothetical protein XA68_14371 [Ophiocordyceps unilateralis]|uniref:F-box domain-containing protein n=1 Tax=Ophiocordyceps unilateralis TaxID=268505 RepID=A0A2A9PAA1_OPHUN|nr:hypothetical protein XA68_14371 [Ophiocordyceps unilateralis]
MEPFVEEPAALRRSIIAKPSCGRAFERLPDEIIEQLLLATDPNGFASLVLVNSRWRAVSQRRHLYLFHLDPCPSNGSSRGDDLPRLRRLFARQVKRNLFDAYLRPRCTVVKLISNSISSSSCPGGEGMQFAPSLRGHHLLAYNSSRIYLIDVRGRDLQVLRELKILRRPASACVTDDATLLAVLSTEVQIDLYDLRQVPPRRKHSLLLNNCPRTIALSSCGSVLVAAYDGGIEVSSLDPGALPTERRSVKCDAVDALTFSLDGTQILGTTTHSSSPSTVVLTAPYYDPGTQLMDSSNLSAMWTTSILFPNTSRDCSHAILLPRDGDHGEAGWTFTYDRSFETFRAVRLDDLRNGTTYFTGPIPRPASQHRLLPCTLPSSTLGGELVSAGFRGSEVWVYGVPGDLDAAPEPGVPHDGASNSSASGRHGGLQGGPSRHASIRGQDGEGDRVPQWQLLCDKVRNSFVAGCKVAELAGVSNVKWVGDFAGTTSRERLIVTARGVSGPRLATDEEDIEFMDGGRIALLDFEYGLVDGQTTESVIEVGTNEAEVLEEEKRDIATEVALVRRRTGARRTVGRTTALRPAGTGTGAGAGVPAPNAPSTPDVDGDGLVRGGRRMGKGAMTDGCDQASIEEQEALDAPYAHASPRSGNTLRRAATAAAANLRLNPRTADGRRIEYRRADGRAEHPHESDADNWVPPPPPYQKEDPGGDLPAFLRGPAVAPPPTPPLPALAMLSRRRSPASSRPFPTAEAEPGPSIRRRFSLARIPSESSPQDALGLSSSVDAVYEDDDLYDVSPPISPCLSDRPLEGHRPHSQEVNDASESWTSASASPPARAQPSPLSVSTPDGASISSCNHAVAYSALAYLDTPDSPTPRQHPGAAEPSQRRLSNAQTWPLFEAAMSGRPTTERRSMVSDGQDGAVRPSSSFSGPSGRTNWGHVRHPSTSVHTRQGSGSNQLSDRFTDGEQPGGWQDVSTGLQMAECDRPLIISTPTGVSGALDPPGRRRSGRRSDTPILAPVPRRPRQNPLIDGSEQVEARSPAREPRRFKAALPVWLRPPTMGSSRSPAGVNRRPSRAERSAAKNILDARRRGWTGERKQKKATATTTTTTHSTGQQKRGSRRQGETDTGVEGGSNADWTDASSPSAPRDKDKKCVVM